MNLSAMVSIIENRAFPLHWPNHWINNEWRGARKATSVKQSFNPNTGKMLVEVPSDREVINLAIDSAANARSSFATTPLTQRIEHLRHLRHALADYQKIVEQVLRLEAGKPAWEARSDFESALNYLDYIASDGAKVLESLLYPARLSPNSMNQNGQFALLPIGITAAYLPFSTALTSFVFYASAAALAGCPLIVCTSSHAMLTGILLSLLLQQADLPPSSINFIFNNFNGFKQILNDKRVAAILYTGSREHCDIIRVESRHHVGRQLILQSGGKNAVIVHSTADVQLAVDCVVRGALTTAGQRCTSTSRVFVYRSLLNQFCEALVEAFKKITIGRTDLLTGIDTPYMGPLYSAKSVEKYLRFQTMANREAEKTLLWGKAIEVESHGYFVSPSIHYLTKFDNGSAYQGNVLFSPDVAIYDYDVLDTAIEHINTTDASFAVSFIGDPSIINDRRHLFLAPNLLINMPTIESGATLPLAGRLQSGHHRYHGPGVAFYLCYPQVLCKP